MLSFSHFSVKFIANMFNMTLYVSNNFHLHLFLDIIEVFISLFFFSYTCCLICKCMGITILYQLRAQSQFSRAPWVHELDVKSVVCSV